MVRIDTMTFREFSFSSKGKNDEDDHSFADIRMKL